MPQRRPMPELALLRADAALVTSAHTRRRQRPRRRWLLPSSTGTLSTTRRQRRHLLLQRRHVTEHRLWLRSGPAVCDVRRPGYWDLRRRPVMMTHARAHAQRPIRACVCVLCCVNQLCFRRNVTNSRSCRLSRF